MHYLSRILPAAVALLATLAACQSTRPDAEEPPAVVRLEPDADDGSIELAEGFRALVVADTLGRVRHLAVRENGDVYAALRKPHAGRGTVALRDTTGDGRADRIEYFTDVLGTGIDLHKGHLYRSSDSTVLRYALRDGALLPDTTPELIAGGFIFAPQHEAKSITFDDDGHLYVNVGAPANACQDPPRQPGAAGQDPCPLLERFGGIWRFRDDQPGQMQEADGYRYATGIRNAVALDWNHHAGALYALQHGRDQLHALWGDRFTKEQAVELPGEEFLLVHDGADFGWPYCYYDQQVGEKKLAPEYGGDGRITGRCDSADRPVLAFPGHWGPNDVLFYEGDQFPERYRRGAFVAFHGSWNRGPRPQQGYEVIFVPFEGNQPTGEWEVFAGGFKGADTIYSTSEAEYRPMGLAEGPDGSLYIADSQRGRVWRVFYQPEAASDRTAHRPATVQNASLSPYTR
ncbi:MAG: PQQ-dependent sugar dehydrogenase [Catalinimonas sp.]